MSKKRRAVIKTAALIIVFALFNSAGRDGMVESSFFRPTDRTAAASNVDDSEDFAGEIDDEKDYVDTDSNNEDEGALYDENYGENNAADEIYITNDTDRQGLLPIRLAGYFSPGFRLYGQSFNGGANFGQALHTGRMGGGFTMSAAGGFGFGFGMPGENDLGAGGLTAYGQAAAAGVGFDDDEVADGFGGGTDDSADGGASGGVNGDGPGQNGGGASGSDDGADLDSNDFNSGGPQGGSAAADAGDDDKSDASGGGNEDDLASGGSGDDDLADDDGIGGGSGDDLAYGDGGNGDDLAYGGGNGDGDNNDVDDEAPQGQDESENGAPTQNATNPQTSDDYRPNALIFSAIGFAISSAVLFRALSRKNSRVPPLQCVAPRADA